MVNCNLTSLKCPLFLVIGTIGTLALAEKNHLRLNLSGSMPYGIYREIDRPITRGSIVAVCLPNTMAEKARRAGLLRQGRCPSKHTPLVKQVIGIPGDNVSVNHRALTINGQSYPAPRFHYNSQHQAVPQWTKYSWKQQSQGYWLYGLGDPIHSWDSRYFGEVGKESLQGVYKPVWVWGKNKTIIHHDHQHGW